VTLTSRQRADLLRDVGLFAEASARGRAAVAAHMVEVEFGRGRTIARQGEVGSGLFVIVSGAVHVLRDGVAVARLGPGDVFGELSVIDRQPRIASVVADEPTVCLALASWDLQRSLEREPRLALALLRVVTRRLREASTDHRH
jgi:CRP/FNR family cyclic AMP-dependent transcriptional regulator